LHLTAILYAVFVVLAVLGLRAWSAAAGEDAAMPVGEAIR
jgi:nicotinamide mononucleotide transporter